MANHQWISTKRLAQLTGDVDPENLPHHNQTGSYGVKGADLGASTDHDGALFIYFGDVITTDGLRWPPYDSDLIAFVDSPPDGAQFLVLEPVRKGSAFYPFTITGHYSAPAGAPLTAARERREVLDVFYIGRDGALWANSVDLGNPWYPHTWITLPNQAPRGSVVAAIEQARDQVAVFFIGYDGGVHVCWFRDDNDPRTRNWHGPEDVTPIGVAPPGGGVATTVQTTGQVEAFFVGYDGAVNVCWGIGGGTWQGPRALTPVQFAPAGARVAAIKAERGHIDVLVVGNDGAVYQVTSPVDHAPPPPVPRRITPFGVCAPGSTVTAAKQSDDQLDVFYIADSGRVSLAWRTPGNVWHGPNALTPPLTTTSATGLGVVKQRDDQLNLVYIGRDGGLHMRWVGETGPWHGPAAITPSNMTPSDQQHAFFLAADGHIDHVFWNARDNAMHRDRWTERPGARPAIGDPAALALEEQQHLFYRDAENHIAHIVYDGPSQTLAHARWTNAPGATRASGDPATLISGAQLHVFYRDDNGGMGHLWRDRRFGDKVSADQWTVGGPPVTGKPAAMAFENQQHVFYRDDESHIGHVFYDVPSASLQYDRWTELSGAPAHAAGNPAAMVFGRQQHVFYRDFEGHIQHLFWDPTTMAVHHDDWTQATGAARALGDPAAMTWRDQQHIFYRDVDEHVTHIFWEASTATFAHDRWTVLANAPLAAGDPAVFVFHQLQQHVFYRDHDGALCHIFWFGPAPTDIKFERWSEPGPGTAQALGTPATMLTLDTTGVLATKQTSTLTDAIFVGRDGEAYVSWVLGDGEWEGPAKMFDYAPLRDGTPCGAFSYDGAMYVFGGAGGPVGLSTTRTPRDPVPLRWLFTVSDYREAFGGRGVFMQIAPNVVENSVLAGSGLPSTASVDGLVMFGQGGQVIPGSEPPQLTNGVFLAWMPLRPGRTPRRSDICYYVGKNAQGIPQWVLQQSRAKQLFPTLFHWSSLSAGYVARADLWIVLYQRTGARPEPGRTLTPSDIAALNETIVARIASKPWDIDTAQEIVIFDPVREQARGAGRYMAPIPPMLDPHRHPPFAYGAYILNRYTRWDPVLSKLTINYLMSTGDPYQVQIMETAIKIVD